MRLVTSPEGDDLLTVLRNDHRNFLLWAVALAEPDEEPVVRQGILDDLRVSLAAHSRAEQATLERELDLDGPLQGLFDIDRQEHAMVDRMLTDLARRRPTGERWLAKARTLIPVLRVHIEEEERRLFPSLQRARRGSLRSMAGVFLAERRRIVASAPAPGTRPSRAD